ncbi:MAG: endodeoxyribonuclease [Actinobacteria bacterium]|jgi:hypothetical protein|nr:endodeoxyribonuclease [Actinomycetota bacterium]
MKKKFTKKQIAIKYGFKSGLEMQLDESLKQNGIDSEYEAHVISYVIPESKHKYHPDFRIVKSDGTEIFLETKGRWLLADRKKMKLIKEQYPNLDIRIIFQNADSRISKNSKTTYGQIATKLGYVWYDFRKLNLQELLKELQ